MNLKRELNDRLRYEKKEIKESSLLSKNNESELNNILFLIETSSNNLERDLIKLKKEAETIKYYSSMKDYLNNEINLILFVQENLKDSYNFYTYLFFNNKLDAYAFISNRFFYCSILRTKLYEIYTKYN